MGKRLISTHSIESFDETDAVNFLKQTLESKHTIKTFFGENEKTPNHDGFFELVDEELTPKKQFIVQIKKTQKIVPNIKGANKGKYVYRLKTNFLEYVKQKVTESPAIYFVVDIESRRIFWLYLSDEVLMKMNFEGHKTIQYAFSEKNILSDISSFTLLLNQIVIDRNRIFVNKTPNEIAEMQDAVDYINQLLNNDFKTIKDSVLPTLWRFGIKCSDNPNISIGIGKDMTPISNAVALYPQMKGKNDSGIHEYTISINNAFDYLSLGGKVNLFEYSKESLHKIIIAFFENRIPAKYLPDIVLFELIDGFVQKSNRFFETEEYSHLTVEEIYRRYILLCRYVQYIFTNSSVSEPEKSLKQFVFNRIVWGEHPSLDITSYCFDKQLLLSFFEFYNNTDPTSSEIVPKIFSFFSNDYLYYLDIIMELKNRNIKKVPQIWNYNWFDIVQMSNDNFTKEIKVLMEKLVSQLPSIYNETYDNLFRVNDYKIRYHYTFKVKQKQAIGYIPEVYYISNKYRRQVFSMSYDEKIEEKVYPFEKNEPDLICTSQGSNLSEIFCSNTPLFCALSCLLYEGICDKQGFNPVALNIGNKKLARGLRFL